MAYIVADRHVLITGASSGIGRECALAFHAAGARVFGVARSGDKLAALGEQLGKDRFAFAVADVTRPDERERALADAASRMGSVDVLVNNAGWAAFGTVWGMPDEHIERMLALNLAAPIAAARAVLPAMLERRQGQIINIASVVGIQAIPRMTVYSATKAALTSFSTGLRMELRGTGVDVINVCPGSTDTPFFSDAATSDARAGLVARTSYTPHRVARKVLKASRRRKPEVTLTVDGNAIAAIRRVSHRVADFIMYHYGRRGMPLEKPARGD